MVNAILSTTHKDAGDFNVVVPAGLLEQKRRELEEAERGYELERAAKLRHGEIPELTRKLETRGFTVERCFGFNRVGGLGSGQVTKLRYGTLVEKEKALEISKGAFRMQTASPRCRIGSPASSPPTAPR